MDLSLIITTHDREYLINQQISALKLKNIDCEIIVVDDSQQQTVSSLVPCEKFKYLWAPKAKGPAESRNLGVRLAHGRRIIFLDDDDFINPDWIIFNKKISTDPDIVFSNYTINQSNKILHIDTSSVTPETQLIKNKMPIGSFSVPIDIAKKIEFNTELASHEDWDYLLKAQKLTNIRHIKEKISCQINPSPTGRNSTTKIENHLTDYIKIYQIHKTLNKNLIDQRLMLLKTKFKKIVHSSHIS